MKFAIIPALSALLLAGMPAHADTSSSSVLRVAQNTSGDDKPGKKGDHAKPTDIHASPAVVPAGQVDAGAGRSGKGGGSTGGGFKGGGAATGRNGATGGGAAAGGGAMTGGGASTGGGAAAGSGHGGATGGGILTGGAPATGRPTGGGAGHGGGTPTGGGAGHGGGATTGGPTGGGILTGGRPTGAGAPGAGHGGAATSGHGGTAFGTRPSNWNQYPRSFDRKTYQRNTTASRSFHWQSYRRPQGWYARRWVFGQLLPNIFWTQDYWLNDYWMFDLPIPPYGYVWVRYGDDALLIDRRTGRVLQVVYGLFD